MGISPLMEVTAVRSEVSTSTDLPQTGVGPPDNSSNGSSALLVGTVLLTGVLLLAYRGFFRLKHLAHRQGEDNGPSTAVPCSNCRFFSKNPYLRCAIHPKTVLTQEATNCSDYWKQDSRQFNR